MLAYKAAVPWIKTIVKYRVPVYMYQNRHLNTAFQKGKKRQQWTCERNCWIKRRR